MKTLSVLFAGAALLLTAACGNDNSSSRRTSTSSTAAPATTVAMTAAATSTAAPAAGSSYSTKSFVVPLDVNVPAWLPAAPSVDEANFVTWEASDAEHAVRMMVPANVYQPGASVATRTPSDYLSYLLVQTDHGARFADMTKTTVGGKPATIVTATTSTGVDGSIGCPADALAAPDCFGLQPDLSLRIAVVDVGDQPLLIWLRQLASDTSPEHLDSFTKMLGSVRFSDRAVGPPDVAPAPVTTPIDGVWTGSWTYDDLRQSPLLYDSGELNDENWGDNTLTLQTGQFIAAQTNPNSTSSTQGSFQVEGDTITMIHGMEKFVMRWSLVGNQLTFSRDSSLGIAPTPLVIRPWTRQG